MAAQPTELFDNIEFLSDKEVELYERPVKICRYLTSLELYLILGLVKTRLHNIETILKLIKPIHIEDELGCWFRNDDWSIYSVVDGIGAHRISFEIFIEPIINNHEICHHCDRKGCVNPWHLFQGTHSDNMRDAIRKGRVIRPSITRRS